MELVTTYICKASDIGVHGNMFGGTILGLVDQSAGAYASQVCDTPRMITVKIDELIFEKPIRIANIVKVYCKVEEFGNTSVTIYVEARKHNVRTGTQEVVLHTNMKFVHVDEEGVPLRIPDSVIGRYWKRYKQYGRGLLTNEERDSENNIT